jgi:hypothetical protein
MFVVFVVLNRAHPDNRGPTGPTSSFALSFAKTSSDSLRIRDLCAKSLEPG